MFITNSEVLTHTSLFYCDKETSDYLQNNGFSLLSIDKDGQYIFVLTQQLQDFLKGGEK